MDNKDIYKMHLHEIYQLNSYTQIIRVVGGWIYEFIVSGADLAPVGVVFIPEKNSDMQYMRTLEKYYESIAHALWRLGDISDDDLRLVKEGGKSSKVDDYIKLIEI